MRRIVFAFFATLFLALVIMALSIGTAGAYASAYDVPTSLCHDPLLGSTMIIYRDCTEASSRRVSVEEPVVTTQPTQAVVQVPPTDVPPTDVPPTDVLPTQEPERGCKNKNSGKDGTPLECNAGIGQEKRE